MSVRRKGNVSAESINRLHSGSGKAGTSKGKRDVVTIGDRVIVQGKQSGIIRFYGNVSVGVGGWKGFGGREDVFFLSTAQPAMPRALQHASIFRQHCVLIACRATRALHSYSILLHV